MKTRDDQLTELLDSLPRVSPSEAFTDEVLTRSRRRSPHRYRAYRRVRWLAAAVLVIAIGSTLALGIHRQVRTPPPVMTSASVDELARQQKEIEADLAQLRRLAAETAPVAYVAGDEHVDIVLDLRHVSGTRNGTQPAVYRPKKD